MALTIANEATANSTSSGPTLALTATAAVGTMLVLGVAADNAGTLGVPSLSTTVTDSAGNLWINRSLVNQTSGAASDGTTLGIWTCTVGTALVAGTVTISFSPDTAAKVAVLQKVTPGAGETVLVTAVGAGVFGNGTAWAAPAVSVANGDTIFGFRAIETTSTTTADSDTTNGSWSSVYSAAASTGTTTSSQAIATQYKTVNATGDQTFDVTGGAARDFAINTLVLSPVTVSGTANGVGAADGTVTATGTAVGTADGSGAAAATATAIGTATGAAAGSGTAAATGIRARVVIGRAAGRATARGVVTRAGGGVARRRTARILFRFDWADGQVTRLWLGAGLYVDADGEIWRGAALVDDSQLDDIEAAINGNATALNVALSGVSPETAGMVWTYYQDGNLISSTVQIMIQPCDARHRPVGSPRVVFGGTIDNAVFEDTASDEGVVSTVTAQISNKFQVRNLANGAVLSDADQRARSAILNPGAEPDRFAERVVLMQTKALVWPRFSG
ncbi:hypothetical protein [Reyranella sp.]|uniref:hypothetical protein n=1 Tax=Reyranella sp. TaxID=1929291 RepID=UPI003D09E4AB